MTLHYLKTFLQLLFRQKVLSVIHVSGLAAGLACCLVIALYVRHELSFDEFFANDENLYHVSIVSVDPAGVERLGAANFYPVAPLLEQNFPEIVAVTRMSPQIVRLNSGDASHYEYGLKLVDANFFELFDFTWLAGNMNEGHQTRKGTQRNTAGDTLNRFARA